MGHLLSKYLSIFNSVMFVTKMRRRRRRGTVYKLISLWYNKPTLVEETGLRRPVFLKPSRNFK